MKIKHKMALSKEHVHCILCIPENSAESHKWGAKKKKFAWINFPFSLFPMVHWIQAQAFFEPFNNHFALKASN